MSVRQNEKIPAGAHGEGKSQRSARRRRRSLAGARYEGDGGDGDADKGTEAGEPPLLFRPPAGRRPPRTAAPLPPSRWLVRVASSLATLSSATLSAVLARCRSLPVFSLAADPSAPPLHREGEGERKGRRGRAPLLSLPPCRPACAAAPLASESISICEFGLAIVDSPVIYSFIRLVFSSLSIWICDVVDFLM
uniref:Uncharacterized protein n=1 Tax=Oryza sativa subsp. japonica TaxID=39947 RepID=Q6Z947_ORYSJ|nr:hypothetical protein [Oryza sativa Japonica Group]